MKLSAAFSALLFLGASASTSIASTTDDATASNANESYLAKRRMLRKNHNNDKDHAGKNKNKNKNKGKPTEKTFRPRGRRGDDHHPVIQGTIGGSTKANNYETNIVGGDVAGRNEYPEFVHWEVGCGGSLITRDIVLTAAHCDSARTVGMDAIISAYDEWAWDSPSGPNARKITAKKPHPDYQSSEINDIMLLKLSQPAPANAPLMKLNPSKGKPSNGQTMTVIGFGDTSDGGSASDTLLEVDIQKISTSWCNGPNRYNGQIDDGAEFCAGYVKNGEHQGGKDSCQGDSGGPVFVTEGNDRFQVGVVSWGIGCAAKRHPGVYARVSNTYDWIKQNACAMSDVSSDLCDNNGGGGGGDNGGDDDNNNGGECDSFTKMKMEFTINTDEYGDETSWILSDTSSDAVIEQIEAGNYANNKAYSIEQCLPKDACYNLQIRDEYGDGISFAGGRYTVKVDGKVIADERENDFGASVDIPFCGSNADDGNGNGDGGDGNDDGNNGSGSCSNGFFDVTLSLTTDDYPEETEFALYDANNNNVVYWYENDLTKTNHEYPTFQACVPKNSCTFFDMYDSYSDGISGAGIVLKADGNVVYSGGDFGGELYKEFPEGCGF